MGDSNRESADKQPEQIGHKLVLPYSQIRLVVTR